MSIKNAPDTTNPTIVLIIKPAKAITISPNKNKIVCKLSNNKDR